MTFIAILKINISSVSSRLSIRVISFDTRLASRFLWGSDINLKGARGLYPIRCNRAIPLYWQFRESVPAPPGNRAGIKKEGPRDSPFLFSLFPLGRPVLCRRGGSDDAALLPLRRHGEHRVEDGVDRGPVAYTSEPSDEGSIDTSRRIPHRIPRSHRRQG